MANSTENSTPKSGLKEAVTSIILAEMDRQQIDRTQLAKKMGWTPYRLNNRLSGKILTVPDVAYIAEALNMRVWELFPTTA
jgi:transcriptional regulator with XRE-family HTH domain